MVGAHAGGCQVGLEHESEVFKEVGCGKCHAFWFRRFSKSSDLVYVGNIPSCHEGWIFVCRFAGGWLFPCRHHGLCRVYIMSKSVVLILPFRLRIEARECKCDTVSGQRRSGSVHGDALMMDKG